MMKKKTLLRLASLLILTVIVMTAMSGCVVIGERKPICTIVFSNGSEVRIRLYPDKCPNTVNNFIKLCNSGFYDGSTVHRILEYVLVQMGMPADSGETDAGYYIKGEFTANKYAKGDLTFAKGVVGMARLSDDSESKQFYDTASSQFFIMLEPKITMDGYYAAFGKVIGNMDAVVAISKMDVDAGDHPRDEIYIVSARVDCYDYKPSAPKTIDKSSVKLP
jgi:peptidyl-prolyl cis-trans isomerase B (cyclophilin B)